MRVVDLLRQGRANAIPARVLADALELPDTRTLTRLVERERRSGSPICASTTEPTGYFLAADAGELSDYVSSLRGREKEIRRTRGALEHILSRWTEAKQWQAN